MAPASHSVRGGFRKGTVAHLSVWEKTVPQLLPWWQTLQFFFVCHWCLSSCYPGAEAQREWVWVSLCVGFLRGTAWDSRNFFHGLNPCWFLQPEVMGTYLPGTGALAGGGGGGWCWAGSSCSWDIPPKFLSTTCGWETSPLHVCAPPTSLDGCGFFNSVVVKLQFNSISDGSEWWLVCISVVILMRLYEEVSRVSLLYSVFYMAVDLSYIELLSIKWLLPHLFNRKYVLVGSVQQMSPVW